MTDIKVGHFYEYRDNVQRYIVIATEVKARGNFMPAVFTGVVVFREGFNTPDEGLAHEIGDVSEDFYEICFVKVANPLKQKINLDVLLQSGRFFKHTDLNYTILVNNVRMYAGGTMDFSGIVVAPTFRFPLGHMITEHKSRIWKRVKNPLKLKNS